MTTISSLFLFMLFSLTYLKQIETVFKSPNLNQDGSVDCDKDNKFVRVTIVVFFTLSKIPSTQIEIH